MQQKKNTSPLEALCAGVLLGAALTYIATYQEPTSWEDSYAQASPAEEFHVHADFLLHLDGTTVDLTQEKYQSTAGDEKIADFHLHDQEGNILHRHAPALTLGSFLNSIGFTLTEDCITADTGTTYCADTTNELTLYVNGNAQANPADFVFSDADQMLLYYGPSEGSAISTLLEQVTDEACIYSGTCPERGTPPPESCGLTCDL